MYSFKFCSLCRFIFCFHNTYGLIFCSSCAIIFFNLDHLFLIWIYSVLQVDSFSVLHMDSLLVYVDSFSVLHMDSLLVYVDSSSIIQLDPSSSKHFPYSHLFNKPHPKQAAEEKQKIKLHWHTVKPLTKITVLPLLEDGGLTALAHSETINKDHSPTTTGGWGVDCTGTQ